MTLAPSVRMAIVAIASAGTATVERMTPPVSNVKMPGNTADPVRIYSDSAMAPKTSVATTTNPPT